MSNVHLEPIDHTASGFADLYDELPLWSAPFGLMLLERVPIRPGLTFLDVGAGTGFLTLELAERAGATGRVIAVDPWTDAIDRLRAKIVQRRLHHVTLLAADAATLDLTPSSIDVIVSNLGINNFDDPDAVLRTCHRVARPGATLVLTTNLVGHMAEFYDVFRGVLLDLGHDDRLIALDAHINHRGTIDTTTERLARAGFDVTDIDRQSFRWRFADGTALLRHHFIRLGFIPGWKSVARPDALAPTFERLEQALNAVASERGELALTVPMACVVARRR